MEITPSPAPSRVVGVPAQATATTPVAVASPAPTSPATPAARVTVDHRDGFDVVRIVDREGNVVQQLPPEAVLRLVTALADRVLAHVEPGRG